MDESSDVGESLPVEPDHMNNADRAVVSVATGPYYPRGQARLAMALNGTRFIGWTNEFPPGSPSHADVPFAFKAYALKAASEAGATKLLWCDACMYPVKPLDRVWAEIESKGYLIFANGWMNSEWTADSAYADLDVTREENETIPHVVATAFGLDLEQEVGRAIFSAYLRLAGTKAFCGPTWNSRHPKCGSNAGAAPCGPETTLGHRHDQTALSVIAHRAGCVLTLPPDIFAYGKLGEVFDDRTVLIADGAY